MKTLILNGSPREQGNTVVLIEKIIQDLQGKYRIVNAFRCNISPISIFEICQYISRYIFIIYLNTFAGINSLLVLLLPCYPYTYPISSRWIYVLTFLHSVLWIKVQGRLLLSCCLIGLMEKFSLSLYLYRHGSSIKPLTSGFFYILRKQVPAGSILFSSTR